MSSEILIFKAPCPTCRKMVFHVKPPEQKVEYFETAETRVLGLVRLVSMAGKLQVVLGPCQKEEPFYGDQDFPMATSMHVKHGCLPPAGAQVNQADTTSGSVFTNSGLVSPGLVSPQLMPLQAPTPIQAPAQVPARP